MILGILFVIILAIIMFILGRTRVFQQNQGTKTVVAICISLLSIFGISKTRWNLEDFFYSMGFGEELLYNLALLAIVAFFIITSIVRDEIDKRIRVRLYRPMIILGLMFIALRFSPWAYGDRTLFVGIPLLAIGGILWNRRRIKTEKKARSATNIRLLGR